MKTDLNEGEKEDVEDGVFEGDRNLTWSDMNEAIYYEGFYAVQRKNTPSEIEGRRRWRRGRQRARSNHKQQPRHHR
jgi:hypothetical protein